MQTAHNNITLDQGGESLASHKMFTQLAIQLAASLSQANLTSNTQAYWAMREVLPVDAQDETKLRRVWIRALDATVCPKAAGRMLVASLPNAKSLYVSLLERLCVVARAKGVLTKSEKTFLHQFARSVGLMPWTTHAIISRYGVAKDPYAVLGVDAKTSAKTLRTHYHQAVRALHPDTYISYGASRSTVAYVTNRLSHINAAYRAITKTHQATAA